MNWVSTAGVISVALALGVLIGRRQAKSELLKEGAASKGPNECHEEDEKEEDDDQESDLDETSSGDDEDEAEDRLKMVLLVRTDLKMQKGEIQDAVSI